MAQLYKMTLYVCDLEDSLSLDEIKTLIRQDALDGVSVNCVCHFAEEHIGKQVEWDDDIDLNECGCPTSVWDKYFTQPEKPMTNADRIRAMTNEELANFLSKIAYARETPWSDPFARKFCNNCPTVEGTVIETGKIMDFCECDFADGKCPHGSDMMWWLQQSAEDDSTSPMGNADKTKEDKQK